MEDNWYQFDGIEQLDTPSLVVYSERVEHNIELLKTMISSPELLRPHVKTNKSIDATKLMMQHGIAKFKCATVAEAEMLGMCKAKDALLAYQPTKAKLERFKKIIKTYPETTFSCLVDNVETAKMISEAAQETGDIIRVFIDLNVGMNRTGIKPALAFDLFIKIFPLPGIKLMGFHAYDGHIRDKDLTERAAHCDADFEPVESLREKVQQHGHPYPLLIAGGSPTFNLHSKRKNVECSPGTFVFWDKGYHDTIPEQNFLFAAVVISRVVSLPSESKICIDLGYKSISSENDLQNRVYFLNEPHLKPYSQSEEHMVIEVEEGHNYKIGDVFYAMPVHICPTVAMYDKAYVVMNNLWNTIWPITSRGREIGITTS
jgi:D-serine deaminase-like pyridoxal phosphate-dependent protein